MTVRDLPDYDTLTLTEPDTDIVLVGLNRPDRLNAINAVMMSELADLTERVDLDRTLRAVVLTGEGRGFCAGADLQGDESVVPGGADTHPTVRMFMAQDQIASVNEGIHRSRKPWIAAVNGACVGGGFAMALACDIRIAAESARFGAVFIKVGVSNCDMGTSYFLPRLVGASRSAELLLTGRIFDADEADRIGLVADVVDDGSEVERSVEIARQIRENGPFAVWLTKETMWETIDSPSLRHAIDIENRTQIMATATGDFAEATQAFRERRAPDFGGL
ncbi:MAG: enoyl-CoA hydratase/isomerase family protein [Actinomycetota bacterium]